MTEATRLDQWFLGNVGTLPRVLLLDGGVSTHLEEKLKGEQIPAPVFPFRELWSSGLLLSDAGRHAIGLGHLDWLQAGANVVSTVTYQCHYELSLWPLDKANGNLVVSNETMDQMWKDGVSLARQAIQQHESKSPTSLPHFVVASSGCYGAALANGAEYTGIYNLEDSSAIDILYNFHRRKIQSAQACQPDGIAIETVPSIVECRALCKLLLSDQISIHSPTARFISLACQNESQLNDGTPLEVALGIFRDVPTDRLHAIGVNCCDVLCLPGLLTILVREIAQFTPQRGLVIYPNSGETWDAAQEQWVDGTGVGTAHEMSNHLIQCLQQIETQWHRETSHALRVPSILLGGCCRTRPCTIAALRRGVDAHLAANST